MKRNYLGVIAIAALALIPYGCKTPDTALVEKECIDREEYPRCGNRGQARIPEEAEYRTMSVDFRYEESRDVKVRVIPEKKFGSLERFADK
mgnify:CR=1 FL=1|jgi:hypothetical protein